MPQQQQQQRSHDHNAAPYSAEQQPTSDETAGGSSSWFSILSLMLFSTCVVFALFVNWFYKLRCRDRIGAGRNRNRKF